MNYSAPEGSRYYDEWSQVAPQDGDTRMIMVDGIYAGEYAQVWVHKNSPEGTYNGGAHLHHPTGNVFYPDAHRTVHTKRFPTELEAVKAIECKVNKYLYKDVPEWAPEALKAGWKAPHRLEIRR